MNAHAQTTLAGHQQLPFVMREPCARVRRVRVIYTVAVVVLPNAGLLVALARGLHHGVGAVELWSFASMYVATVLGITVGYHRGFAHHAFVARPALEVVLLALGAMAGQGPVMQWVADHRRHHQFSDRAGDPHSPYLDGTVDASDARSVRAVGIDGWWHAHVGWLFSYTLSNTLFYCRDLLRNPRVRFFSNTYPVWVGFGLLLPALAAYVVRHDIAALISGLLWGGFVRLAISSQAAFAMNSLTHMLGSRPFDTDDRSGNVAWLAIPTLGESWHNNHHAHPRSAYFGLRAWQVDIGGWFITAMSRLGLLTRVHGVEDAPRNTP